MWAMGGVLNEEGRDRLEEVIMVNFQSFCPASVLTPLQTAIPAENSGVLPKILTGERLRDFYIDGLL